MELCFSNGVEPLSSRRTALTNTRAKVVALAFSGLVLLGLSSLRASARIVCNENGDCWHAPDEYAYPPSAHLSIHPGNWRWKEGEHYAWKEHEGRGYWHGGEWRGF
jgi:hypothetical protein